MAYRQKSNPFLKTAPFKNHVPGHGLPTDEQDDLYPDRADYTTDSLKWVDEGWHIKDIINDEGGGSTRVWVQEKDPEIKEKTISRLEKLPTRPLETIESGVERELELPSDLESKTQSVSSSSQTQRKPTYAYQKYRGFQIPIAMNIWDESSNSWKRRPLEPEEIEYEKNKVRKRTGG
jgi:hypothetical protein